MRKKHASAIRYGILIHRQFLRMFYDSPQLATMWLRGQLFTSSELTRRAVDVASDRYLMRRSRAKQSH